MQRRSPIILFAKRWLQSTKDWLLTFSHETLRMFLWKLFFSILFFSFFSFGLQFINTTWVTRYITQGCPNCWVPLNYKFPKAAGVAPDTSSQLFMVQNDAVVNSNNFLLKGEYRIRKHAGKVVIQAMKSVPSGRAAPPRDVVDKEWVFDAARFELENMERAILQDTIPNYSSIAAKYISLWDSKLVEGSSLHIDYDSSQLTLNRTKLINSEIEGSCYTTSVNESSIIKNSVLPYSYSTSVFNSTLDSSIISLSKIVRLEKTYIKQYCEINFSEQLHLENVSLNGKLKLIVVNAWQSQGSRIEASRDVLDTISRAKVTIDYNVNLDALIFNPSEILFVVDMHQKDENGDSIKNEQFIIQTYKKLINHFEKDKDEKKFYDISYQQYLNKLNKNGFKNFIQERWNGYGYNTESVWGFSLTILIFFFAINNLMFPFILEKGYPIKTFDDTLPQIRELTFWKRYWNEIFYCALFTIMLFLIFKVDMEKLQIKNKGLTVWILLQHVVGIVLIAFLVHAIFD